MGGKYNGVTPRSKTMGGKYNGMTPRSKTNGWYVLLGRSDSLPTLSHFAGTTHTVYSNTNRLESSAFVPHESSVLWYGYVLLTFVICTHSPATRSAKISWLGDGMSVDVAMIGCVGSVDGTADDLLILWFLPPHLRISRCILSVSWVEVLDRWW